MFAFSRSFRVSAALPALVLAVLVALPAVAAERSEATLLVTERFAELQRWYDAHPELKDEKGSGWKPYNRAKWFVEQRMQDGELPAADARWRAWEERQRRLAGPGRSGSPTWFSLGPANFAGRMLSLAFDPGDPSIVYGGSAGGGLWKSTDSGASWVPLTDELPSLAIGGVAVSPVDPDLVVIATGEGTFNIDRIGGVGILRSTDAGVTWETTSVSFAESSGHGFHFVEASPAGTFLAGATDGLYRSDDGGANWTKVRNGGNYYDAKWKPGETGTVYTVRGQCNCAGANVKISTDDGITWAEAGTGQPSGNQIGKSKIAVTAADPERIWAIYVNRSTANLLGVYRSDDGGSTWNVVATTPNIPGGQGWYNLSLTADPDDADRVIAGGVNLFGSTDGGVTWTGIGGGVHVDHHVAAYEPGSASNVWVGSDGGLWRSTADGAGWTDRNSGLVTYQFYDICVNNGPTAYFVMGGTQDNGTDKWAGTTTWSEGLFADGMVCNISPVNGKTVYAEIQFGSHYKNTNFGEGNWNAINSGITGNGAWVTPVDQDQNQGNHLYTSTSAGIFRTTQGGNPWVQVAGHTATWISISPVDGDIVWSTGGSTRVSTDDGATWTSVPFGFSTGNPTKILAHPTNPDAALATFSGYSASTSHVAYTTDLGSTWSDVTGDLPPQPVNAVVVDPDRPEDWYVGTDVGVWKSTDGGVTWLPFGEDIPNTVIVDLEIQRSERKLVAGTHGRGAWEADIPLSGTGVDVAEVAPRNLMLDRPAPNPARDRTLLRFAARADGPVSLAVYDVRGRLVNDLVELPTGDGIVRTTPWFPDDAPSGVYFAVLRAGGERISRKIVVTR
jgi:hypothetical protein